MKTHTACEGLRFSNQRARNPHDAYVMKFYAPIGPSKRIVIEVDDRVGWVKTKLYPQRFRKVKRTTIRSADFRGDENEDLSSALKACKKS